MPEEVTTELDFVEVLTYGIQMYYTPVLVCLGSLGNCFSVCVFLGAKMRRSSSSVYLAALAISDTGFLGSLFVVWLNLVDVSLFNRQGFCQLFVYSTTLCSFLSVWFVVAFTVERFIAVQYPLRRQSMCTVTRAKVVLACLSMLGLILCSPVLWFSSPRPLNERHNASLCNLAPEWESWANIFNVLDTVFTFILPFFIIVILNSLIARSVWRLAGVRRTMTRETSRRDRQCFQARGSSTSQAKVTKMLLVVSSVFLCFNLPAYVMRVRAFLEVDEDPPRIMVVAQHVSNMLFHTNFGINFALYCVSGQNFRRAVIRVLCPRSVRRNSTRNQIASEFRASRGPFVRQRTVVLEAPWEDHLQMQPLSN